MPAAEYLDLALRDLLEEIASRTPAPGGGSVAAIGLAMGASLVEMAARFSEGHWAEAGGAVAQAKVLRERAAPLAREDAEAYERALAALRLPKDGDPEERDRVLGRALEEAAAVPFRIAEIAADVASLAAEAAQHGNPNLRGDAAAGALLAEAAAHIGANLVAINLGVPERDERVARVREFVVSASEAAGRALVPAP
jgi:formiminotetrahydrofolate cyclodeaminase